MREMMEHQQDSVRLQAELNGGQLNGETRIEEHGRLLAVLRYRQGVLHGVMERWYLTGSLPCSRRTVRAGRTVWPATSRRRDALT